MDKYHKMLRGKFYRAKDLDEKEKLRAKRGLLRHVRGIELDGSLCGGGFYIYKTSLETVHHFCQKYLFAELHPSAKVEYWIDNRWVDVAFITETFRIAVEIETGSNNSEQIQEKAAWLNEHFDVWLFVCPRKYLGKYDPYVDYQKSFCCTVKQAKEKLLQLFAAMQQVA